MSFLTVISRYPFADIRIDHCKELTIQIREEEIKISAGDYVITSARVLIDGSWGFANSNKHTVDIEELLKKAAVLARLQNANVKLKKCNQEKTTIKKQKKDIKYDERVAILCDAAKEMKGDHVKSKTINYRESIEEKEFYNSDGSEIVQLFNRAYISCMAVARSGELIQRGQETDASIDGFNKINVYETAEAACKKAEKFLFAGHSSKGHFTTILDNEMTGVFCHEALGHACEADSIIERGSILRGKIGKKIGNRLATIVDDPIYNGFGHYIYDDEGVKAKKVTLIDKGILKNYMNSRETAAKLNMELNGHCRAMGAAYFPIVRMSNTFMLPGETKLDELFDIRNGIYVKGMSGGSVDIFSGGFMFKAEEAYEIKNGEIGKLLRDVSLSGNILDALKSIELIGNDFGMSPGTCGKFGQGVPVSDGGPHIRVGDIKIG